MTLSDVLELIRGLTCAEHYYCGILDAKKDKSIGIYQGRALSYEMPVSRAKGTHVKSIKLLVHWSHDSIETEEAAYALHEALSELSQVQINDYIINFCKPTHAEPMDIGQDSRGIFERVIEFEIYYQKKGV